MGVHLLCRLFNDSAGIDLFIQVRRAQTRVAASAMISLIFKKLFTFVQMENIKRWLRFYLVASDASVAAALHRTVNKCRPCPSSAFIG